MWHRVWRSHRKESTSPHEEAPSSTAPRAPTDLDLRVSEELKNEGNELFKRGKFMAAAEKYTEAITVRPKWAGDDVYGVRKVGNWERVEDDCRVAIEADSQSMKGHYFLGLALEERQDHASALCHLEKSYELARDKEEKIMDEIWKTIARVSYSQWEREAQQRKAEDVELMTRLRSLLTQAQATEKNFSINSAEVEHTHAQEQQSLDRLFHRATAADVPRELPGSFTCPISMDVFRDPVLAPSGFSYEYADIKEHIEKVGPFDPITRQPIERSQLIHNINLRTAAHLYLKEHPWAWKECL